MGIERYDELIIGFVVDAEDILKPFAVKVPAKFHMEDRFDVKTGKKLAPVKVEDDEEHDEYEVDGERFVDLEGVMDHLCNKCGGRWQTVVHGEFEGENVVAIEPELKENALLLKNIGKLAKPCEKIRRAFKKYGIELGEAEVQTVETWG